MSSADLVNTDGQLDAVDRSLAASESDGVYYVVARLAQVFPTGIDDLWNACSTPERLACWFGPVAGDLQLGGRFQIEGNAEGTIQSCDPPNGIKATWEFGGQISYIAVDLEAVDSGHTRLSMTHSGDIPTEWWEQYGPGAGGIGWDLAFLGLSHYLATNSTTPAESTEWAGTEDAKRFMAGSSQRWADLSIQAGTPEGVARAAEKQTTAMYLGVEE